MSALQRQLWLLTGLRAIRMFMVSIPVITVYWQSHDLTIMDIMILQVIFSVAIIVLELPSGYIADRCGNKPTLVFAAIAGVIGFFWYWYAPSYEGFVIAELILALSASLMSGSRDALLYDTLAAHNATASYTHHSGRMMAGGQVSEAMAALCASLIVVSFTLETVMLVQFLTMFLAIPVALNLKSYRPTHHEVSQSLWSIVHYCFFGNRRLLWLNVFTGAVSASTLTMVWFTQPLWGQLGIDLVYFGPLWMLMMLIVAAGSVLAGWIEARVRFRLLFCVIACSPLVLYGLVVLTASWLLVVPIALLFSLIRGVSMPIVSAYVQRECISSNRATVLSANALVGRIIFSLLSPFLGWVSDVWSFEAAFLASALTFGVISLAGFVQWFATVKIVARA